MSDIFKESIFFSYIYFSDSNLVTKSGIFHLT